MKQKAIELIREFKANDYVFGVGCIHQLGNFSVSLGKSVSVVALSVNKSWAKPIHEVVLKSLHDAGMILAGDIIHGASPNAPLEDVYRICESIKKQKPEVIVSFGGGSSIDATKAAIAFAVLGDKYSDINQYFGVGNVHQMLQETNRQLIPMVAVQLTSGSAAHLTKYSNVTNTQEKQKSLIIDNSIIPPRAVFDYSLTTTQNKDLTLDGAFDGISHCLEVFMGIPEESFERVKPVCLTAIELIVSNIKKAVNHPSDIEAREAIGLGTDLGGYAIMIGGTNGAHLNSFSMTDILAHGRACALMNPYYVVFFSTAIEKRLRMIAAIYKKYGYIGDDTNHLNGRDLGIAVAKAMIALSKEVGFPTTLSEVPGFSSEHISRCLSAAKRPSMESKLHNMPVRLSSDNVDIYMKSVLLAAEFGEIELVRNVS